MNKMPAGRWAGVFHPFVVLCSRYSPYFTTIHVINPCHSSSVAIKWQDECAAPAGHSSGRALPEAHRAFA